MFDNVMLIIVCLFVNVDDTASKGLIWKSVTGTKNVHVLVIHVCTCTIIIITCVILHNYTAHYYFCVIKIILHTTKCVCVFACS